MIRYIKSFSNTIWILILIVCLGLIALLGDRIVLRSATKWRRVIADSCTHSLIGAVTWLVICINCRRSVYISVYEIFICAFFSSLIDVDHFVAARSFKLKDALNLSSRPFLHCSSVTFLTIVAFIAVSKIFESRHFTSLSWIILVAFSSHHIRDAARHGFWIWPLGSTPPLQYFMYIILTMCLPIIIIFSMDITNFSSKSSKYILEQWQIELYVIAGCLFLTTLTTFTLIICLFVKARRLDMEVKKLMKQPTSIEYMNPKICPNEELDKRGFTAFTGNRGEKQNQ